MPRPDSATPFVNLSNTVRAMGPWFAEHQQALLLEIEDGFDGQAIASELSQELDEAQDIYRRELLEDKDVLTRRAEVLTAVGALSRSLRASVQRRLNNTEHPNPERVRKDFATIAPSSIRTGPAAQKVLTQLRSALATHEAVVRQGGRDRFEGWAQNIADLEARIRGLADEMGQERNETDQAFVRRQTLRSQALNFIENMLGACDAVESEHSEPGRALRLLFDVHNPAPTPSS